MKVCYIVVQVHNYANLVRHLRLMSVDFCEATPTKCKMFTTANIKQPLSKSSSISINFSGRA